MGEKLLYRTHLNRRRHLRVVEANLLQGVDDRLARHALGHAAGHEVHDVLLLLAQDFVLDVVHGDVRGEPGDVLGGDAIEQRLRVEGPFKAMSGWR
jgi:hypothetical protein